YAMTGRYTHARLHDLAATVASLPPLVPPPSASEAVAATGTEGKPLKPPQERTESLRINDYLDRRGGRSAGGGKPSTGPENLAPNLAPQADISGNFLTR